MHQMRFFLDIPSSDFVTMATFCICRVYTIVCRIGALNASIIFALPHILYLAQKRPKLVQNMHFWSIWGKYWLFCPFCQMPDQITMRTRCPCGFSVVWVTIFLISPVKIRIFCPKTTKFGPKLAFLVILSFCHLVPCWRVCWWFVRGLYLARHLFT